MHTDGGNTDAHTSVKHKRTYRLQSEGVKPYREKKLHNIHVHIVQKRNHIYNSNTTIKITIIYIIIYINSTPVHLIWFFVLSDLLQIFLYSKNSI